MNRPVVVATIADLRAAVAGTEPGLVPTMGALHEGHLALVDKATRTGRPVVVSIFVNPMQFGPGEDLERYPRTLDSDVEALTQRGVDFVFAPSAAEMYPAGPVSTRVTAGPLGNRFEGASRPGHFDGMLTVVSKLFNIVQPSTAYFGRKDAQQAFLVRRMVTDLNMPVRIEVVDTVRAADGLALSSRNRFLTDEERRASVSLWRALEAARSSADRGVDSAFSAAQGTLAGEPLLELDYLAIVDPETFLPVDGRHRGAALTLVAARVGDTRLIDNEPIVFP